MSEPEPFVSLTRDLEGGLMIRFSPPPKEDEFAAWGVDLARRAGGEIVEAIDAPEGRVWRIAVDGQELHFLFSPDHGTFLAAFRAEAEPTLERIYALLQSTAERIAPKRPETP